MIIKNSTTIAMIAALGGFLFGFEVSVISGAEQTIQQLWALDSFWLGFTVASSLIGTVLGSLMVGKPAQWYGRRPVLFGIALLYLVSAVGCAMASSWILFVLFRFLGGIAVGASSVVGPMYITEIAPARSRGRLAGMFQLNIVAGILMAYLTNFLLSGYASSDSWRFMLAAMAVPAIIFLLLLFFLPESPRWLIANGYENKGKEILLSIGQREAISEILSSENRFSTDNVAEDLFTKKYRKPIFYAVLLAMFNQLSGINAILYYAPRVFAMAGFDKSDSFQQSVLIGLANFVCTILAMGIIDKVGRKKLLLIGAAGMSVFLFLTATAFSSIEDGGAQNSSILIYIIGFIAFFAFSQGAVIWVFISEIFPNAVRAQGSSLGSFTHWIMAAVISWLFPIIAESSRFGGGYSFIFYGLMMVISFIFIWRVMPETKGKSLEQIQDELGIK